MKNSVGYKVKNVLALALLIGLGFSSSIGRTQQTIPGSNRAQEYDPALNRRSSYGNFERLGPGGIEMDREQRPGQQQQEEIRVLIKTGKKVYCAWSDQLLDNDVQFDEVVQEEASKYYDDGTHNDEIPFDGLPSSVTIDKNLHISPYALAIKENLERLKEKVLTLETSEQYKVNMWKQLDKWDPLQFYSGLYVTSLDAKSGEMPKFVDKITDLTDYIDIFDQSYIEQFRNFEYYPDKENPQWERALWSKVSPKSKVVRKRLGLDRKKPQSRTRSI